jgi:uncharacterized DUF497 family protein
MSKHDYLLNCTGFEWDKHNAVKIWNKHHVTPSECEQIFFNLPIVIASDEKHSRKEKRYYALGQTDLKRFLFVAFTVRKDRIRIISARNMNRKERKVYQSHEKENPKI